MDFSSKYLELINGEYKGINLTRILDYEEFKQKQYNDSIYPVFEIKEINILFNSFKYIVDIGFGGGFPILPLASVCSDKVFLGFEARRKKVLVVTDIAKKLEISNVNFFHQRVEDIIFDKNVFILVKAVGKIDDFLAKINCAAENICVGFYKGPDVYNLEKTIVKNWELKHNIRYLIDDSIKRNFLIYKKRIVPRGTTKKNKKIIKNNFAKLSSFL